jgi:hypothetical protein
MFATGEIMTSSGRVRAAAAALERAVRRPGAGGSRRRRLVLVGVAVAASVGLLTWMPWPAGPPAPRTRPYLGFTACLLTDGQGVAGPAAAPVWAGMQDASLATRAKVQYLAVAGEATVGNARPYLAGLVQRHCGLLLVTGPAQIAAVAADAGRYPSARFVTVGGGASTPNVTVVDATTAVAVQCRVAALVAAAVHAAAGD